MAIPAQADNASEVEGALRRVVRPGMTVAPAVTMPLHTACNGAVPGGGDTGAGGTGGIGGIDGTGGTGSGHSYPDGSGGGIASAICMPHEMTVFACLSHPNAVPIDPIPSYAFTGAVKVTAVRPAGAESCTSGSGVGWYSAQAPDTVI
ncbi:hypothetical protein [Polyangium sp. 15x6]|uniref:hypothetical protein n=1 Tax=Polyangium sp. 15x6 TaxID=3042687 RepID=UPI00249CE760|nr:hypothetical protein [Polyangium sp. 15x6]MDI3282833.1 hypothetical protein [Polyangium sp. 15x6]